MSDAIRVLAIDDESYILKVLEVCLREPEYKLTTCCGADGAIAAFKSGKFDIILMDVVMPNIDGFELHSMIRAIDATIPIIMLTARIDDINGIMLKKVSSDRNTYYQSKSFTKAILTSKINQIVLDLKKTQEKDAYFAEMSRDLSIAGEIQRFLFPKWTSFGHGRLVSYYYRPYQNITGDMFNTAQIEDGVTLAVVGDISGHGIPAALYISALRLAIEEMLRKMKPCEVTPDRILNNLQSFMRDISSDRYMTSIACIIDYNKNKICFQSAGHPDFIVYSPSKNELLRPDYRGNGSIPLGMLSDSVYSPDDSVEFDITDDAIILFFSDGLTELTNKNGEAVGSTLVCDLLKSFARKGLESSTVFKLMDTILKIGYDEIKDDISIAAIAKLQNDRKCLDYLIRPMLEDADKCAQNIARDVLEKTGNDELASKCEIVASEFLNNIVVHGMGNKNVGRPMIYVNVVFGASHLELSFYDKGKEWSQDSAAVTDERHYSDVLNKKSADSGRGMSIIRQITSSILRNRYADILNETIISIAYR